ncbi:MAG: glycosyltransferase family 4 protein [Candidatus Brocadia sp.]|nr:glycosyltransferase family 4 protein [Candidatus Brocadia sp.]
MKILFLSTEAFSSPGGIQKFNKAFMKALQDLSESLSIEFKAFSLRDENNDNKYINSQFFKGFKYHKTRFIIESIIEGLRSDIIILGHLNLAVIGLIVKILNNKAKIILISHGVEVWSRLYGIKKRVLNKASMILAVSNFTKKKLINENRVRSDKIYVFPNTIDPFFVPAEIYIKPHHLMQKYKINQNDKILLTVCRIDSTEKYKGYDKIIEILPSIIHIIPNVKYLLVGKGDETEIKRIEALVERTKIKNNVIMTGYVAEEDLINYYLLSDLFIMPSKGEGFGIVFLEALSCGTTVIAGNKDGSVDALSGGKLGILIDPDNIAKITQTVLDVLNKNVDKKLIDRQYLSQKVIDTYGFDRFKERLKTILTM